MPAKNTLKNQPEKVENVPSIYSALQKNNINTPLCKVYGCFKYSKSTTKSKYCPRHFKQYVQGIMPEENIPAYPHERVECALRLAANIESQLQTKAIDLDVAKDLTFTQIFALLKPKQTLSKHRLLFSRKAASFLQPEEAAFTKSLNTKLMYSRLTRVALKKVPLNFNLLSLEEKNGSLQITAAVKIDFKHGDSIGYFDKEVGFFIPKEIILEDYQFAYTHGYNICITAYGFKWTKSHLLNQYLKCPDAHPVLPRPKNKV